MTFPDSRSTLETGPLLKRGSLIDSGEFRKLAVLMADAARAYLDTLSSDARAACTHAFEVEFKRDWNFLPYGSGGRRWGMSWHDLSDQSRKALIRLLEIGLSEQGLQTALDIVEIERVQHPQHGVRSYSVWFFGEPSPDANWMWRFEGHHLSLNFALSRNGTISVTPAFWGLSPTRLRFPLDSALPVGRRVLADLEDLAGTIYRSLGEEARLAASVALPNMDDRTPQDRFATRRDDCGVSFSELSDRERNLLYDMLRSHFNLYTRPIAEWMDAKLIPPDSSDLYLACAAADDGDRPRSTRPDGFYLRVQGPRLLLEHDDVQFGAQGTGHIHTLMRDFEHDFGGVSSA